MNDPDQPHQSCGGCQLVSYCSRDCQKSDWSTHKPVCKAFPLVGGKNVLWAKGSWKKHLTGLLELAAQLPDARAIFRNPRVCNTCQEPRPEHLTDCGECHSVCHCSKRCKVADKLHKGACKYINFLKMAYIWLKPTKNPNYSYGILYTKNV